MIQKMTIAFLIIVVIILFYLILRRVLSTFRNLTQKRYPKFIYTDVKTDELGIPVFVYHSIGNSNIPDSVKFSEFECHMQYLSMNNYHTINADELYNYLVYDKPIPPKSVVITFDDGRASLWTLAFPILKKYNFKAVCFLVPSMMSEIGVRSNFKDYEDGRPVSMTELLRADLSNNPAITWEEAKVMHTSGLVDFQSHTLNHTLIYTTAEIVDFINPSFYYGYNNHQVPVIRYGDIDKIHFKSPLGTPIYRSAPLMYASRRFFDDEGLRNACVDFVEKNGHEAYFTRPDWRIELLRFVEKYRQEYSLREGFNSTEEMAHAIRESLIKSKQLIEKYLPSHSVKHLCFPWNRYSIMASCYAKKAGYITAFIDINPQKPFPDWNNSYTLQRFLPINEPGDDPFQITRIDARDNIILSLPGKGRLTCFRRFALRLLRLPSFL